VIAVPVVTASPAAVKNPPAPPAPPPFEPPPPPPPATTRYSTVGGDPPATSPATYRLPYTLPPPATVNAPVIFDVAGVVAVTANLVPVITATFALPAELNVMLPLADGMFTLLFPLLILAPPPPDIPVN
jgi:hypothetical protein